MYFASTRRSSTPSQTFWAPARTAIERIPQPQERLHRLKARVVALAVVFRLERDVARIHGGERQSRRHRQRRVFDRGLPIVRVLGIEERRQRLAAEQRAIGGTIRERRAERVEPSVATVRVGQSVILRSGRWGMCVKCGGREKRRVPASAQAPTGGRPSAREFARALLRSCSEYCRCGRSTNRCCARFRS